jgi:hypothetical protein
VKKKFVPEQLGILTSCFDGGSASSSSSCNDLAWIQALTKKKSQMNQDSTFTEQNAIYVCNSVCYCPYKMNPMNGE